MTEVVSVDSGSDVVSVDSGDIDVYDEESCVLYYVGTDVAGDDAGILATYANGTVSPGLATLLVLKGEVVGDSPDGPAKAMVHFGPPESKCICIAGLTPD